jgi:small subunit ribosomal protein S3
MGHKVNPTSMRLQLNKNWQSKWIASKGAYKSNLSEDIKIRRYLDTAISRRAGIDKVETERSRNTLNVIIHASKPGIIIGRAGAGIDELKKQLQKIVESPLQIKIEEVKRPELRAKLVAENVAGQLEKRFSFRRAIKTAADNSMQAGAQGVKVMVSGRIGGNEMARREKEIVGSIPLHTLRANIDYGFAAAKTTTGIVGVKVWIYTNPE